MQLGFDSEVMGVGDGANFLAGLKRALLAAQLDLDIATGLHIESVLGPVRAAWSHWKKIEPYEFRLPVPEAVVEAILGVCIVEGRWTFLIYIMVVYHCWLRPAEGLALTWDDLHCVWGEELTFGVVRIREPKVKSPPVQHVLVEALQVRNLIWRVWLSLGQPRGGRVLAWSPALVARQWTHCLNMLFLDRDVVSDKRLASRRFTVGGLRPGAATADYLRTQNTSRTQWRGRWASPQVLRHYLQLGTYHLMGLSLPCRVVGEALRYQKVFREFALWAETSVD